MTIARIGEVQAREGMIEALREFLISIMPLIQGSEGCRSVELYQSQEDPARFTIIEVWDSVEAHQASVRNIPPEKLGEIRPLLATSPGGGYFRLVRSSASDDGPR